MARVIEYHVTVAVPVTINDDGTFVVGEPYENDCGTPLNSDTYDIDAEEWDQLDRMDLPADWEAIMDACSEAVLPPRVKS